MALVTPPWLLGKHLTSVTARYQVADATGTITDGASTLRTFTGIIDGISYAGRDDEEDIAALTSEYENPMSVQTNDSFTLTEIMRNSAGNNWLASFRMNTELATGGQYVLLTFVRGGTNSFTFYGLMSNYRESARQGKSVAMMDLQIIDILDTTPIPDVALPNPAYGT